MLPFLSPLSPHAFLLPDDSIFCDLYLCDMNGTIEMVQGGIPFPQTDLIFLVLIFVGAWRARQQRHNLDPKHRTLNQVTGGHKSNDGLSRKERKLLDKICKYYALPEWVQVSHWPGSLNWKPYLTSPRTKPRTPILTL